VKPLMTSVLVIMSGIIFNSVCNAEDAASSYSELLKQIGEDMANNPTGRPLPLATDCWQFKPHKEKLGQIDAVPFLVQAIQQGPDWQDEYKG